MHGHVHGVAPQVANPYSAVALEKAAAAQRAAMVKRRLAQAAAELSGDASDDAVEMLEAWGGGAGQSQPRRPREWVAVADSSVPSAISFWA